MNVTSEEIAYEGNSFFASSLLFNTIVIVIFVCFGLTGNLLVLYVYKYKMPQTGERFFIPYLAVADLLSCVCLVSLGIANNFHFVYFPNEKLCQLLHYFSWVTTSWSAFILLMISVSRYLKICRPTGNQMTMFRKKCAVGGCLIFSIVNTLPVAFFSGYRFQDVDYLGNNMTVMKCGLREFQGTWHSLKMAYVFFEIIVLILNVSIAGLLYIPIGREIFRRFKGKQGNILRIQTNSADSGDTDHSTGNVDVSTATGKFTQMSSINDFDSTAIALSHMQNNHQINVETNVVQPAADISGTSVGLKDVVTDERPLPHVTYAAGTKDKSKTRQKKSITAKGTMHKNIRKNFTYMFLTIIVFYILSYVPTMVVMLLGRKDPFHFWYSMDVVKLNIVMLLRRSSIINHIVNPFIYGYFDLTFRKAFQNVFMKCKI